MSVKLATIRSILPTLLLLSKLDLSPQGPCLILLIPPSNGHIKIGHVEPTNQSMDGYKDGWTDEETVSF